MNSITPPLAPASNRLWVPDCAFITGIAILMMLPTVIMPLGPDQSALACAARRILLGRPPYLDVTYLFPGSSLLYALAMRTLSDAAWSIHLLDIVCVVISSVALYGLALQLFDRVCALAAGLAFSLMYIEAGFWSYAQTDEFLNPILLLVLLCWWKSVASNRISWSLLAGVGCAAAMLCRLSAATVAICLPIIWWSGNTETPSWRRLIIIAGGTLTGAVLTLGALAVAATQCGYDLRDFIVVWTVVVPNHVARHSPSNDSLILRGLLAGTDFFFVSGNRLVAVCAILGTMPLLLLTKRERRVWLVSTYLLATLAMAAAQRRFSAYHWLPTMPPWCLLAASAMNLRHEFARLDPLRGQRMIRVYLASALVLFLFAEHRQALRYCDFARAVASARARDDYLQQFRTEPPFISFSAVTERDAARYVRANTPTDESVFIWGFAPAVYYQAQRDTPARWMYHLYFDSPKIAAWGQAEYVDSIRRAAPAFIVVRKDLPLATPGVAWHDASANLDALPALRDFLHARYSRDRTFGYLIVYRRKP